jgi:hypothetical protein
VAGFSVSLKGVWNMATALGIVLGVCAVELIALVWLGLRRHARRRKEHPYVLTPAALRPLHLTDEHWAVVCQANDFEDFTPAEFSEDICVWDRSDENNWDFLVSVDVTPLIRVASTTIKIGPFADLGCGSSSARAVLQQLLDERNHLVSALATATGQPVIASSL